VRDRNHAIFLIADTAVGRLGVVGAESAANAE